MIKVACIGDSITWGFTLLNPWRQGFCALLKEMLGPEYEMCNFEYNDAAARFDSDTRLIISDGIATFVSIGWTF